MLNIFSSYLHENIFNLDNKKIKKDILNIKSKDKGRTISNYGGWQSIDSIKIDKPFVSLFKQIDKSVETVEKKLNLKNKLVLGNYWCNINYFGCFNKPHNHKYSVISGVYYVDVPKNSGNLVFEQYGSAIDETYKFVNTYNEYNSCTWTVVPKENLCVLFPSHLYHYVESNLNKKERISISFNYGF
jgi:uncharacterized protein (TIGR02466 family)